MVTCLSDNNSLLNEWMCEIRSTEIQTDRMRFRRNIERVGEIAAYEISRHFIYKDITIQTPLGESVCKTLEQQPVLAAILRAGLPLHQGLLNYFDKADNAFIAAYRKHHRDGTFEIELNYHTSPDCTGRPLIIADPMLATGASLSLALQSVTENNMPSQIHIVSVLACTIGIDYILRKFPQAFIWVGAIDEELTARGYIVPGLGDAGDLAYGSKIQS